jgi:hypothetical protein
MLRLQLIGACNVTVAQRRTNLETRTVALAERLRSRRLEGHYASGTNSYPEC